MYQPLQTKHHFAFMYTNSSQCVPATHSNVQIPISVHVSQPGHKASICQDGMDASSSIPLAVHLPPKGLYRQHEKSQKISANIQNIQDLAVFKYAKREFIIYQLIWHGLRNHLMKSTCSTGCVSSAMRAKFLEGHSAWEGTDLTVLPPASATVTAAFGFGDSVPVARSDLAHTL